MKHLCILGLMLKILGLMFKVATVANMNLHSILGNFITLNSSNLANKNWKKDQESFGLSVTGQN